MQEEITQTIVVICLYLLFFSFRVISFNLLFEFYVLVLLTHHFYFLISAMYLSLCNFVNGHYIIAFKSTDSGARLLKLKFQLHHLLTVKPCASC